jgi:hypothetical protein
MTTRSDQRVAEARVRVGNALADAVPCLTLREQLARLIDEYGTTRERRGEVRAWRKAMDSHERLRRKAG